MGERVMRIKLYESTARNVMTALELDKAAAGKRLGPLKPGALRDYQIVSDRLEQFAGAYRVALSDRAGAEESRSIDSELAPRLVRTVRCEHCDNGVITFRSIDGAELWSECPHCDGTLWARETVTCAGCRHYITADNPEQGWCCAAGIGEGLVVSADHGCRWWEEKV